MSADERPSQAGNIPENDAPPSGEQTVRVGDETVPVDDEQAATIANADEAPEPDDPRKPQRVVEIRGRSWRYVFRRAWWSMLTDVDIDAAGALTYSAILSLFPGLLAMVSALGVVGQGRAATNWIVNFLGAHAPASVVELVGDPIRNLATTAGAGWVLAFSLAIAVWSAGGYVAGFGRAMNKIYGVAEGRPLWKIIPYNLLLTVITLVFAALAMLTVLLSGDIARVVGDAVGLGAETQELWRWIKWPILGIAAIVFTSLMYYATPNVRQPHFRWITVGSVLALAVMAGAVVAFSEWVNRFGRFNAYYGVIGSVIVLLLGVWIVNLALLFGARVDAELERVRELQAGLDAADRILLPPRDDRVILATARTQQRFVEKADRIRFRGPRRNGPTPDTSTSHQG